MDATKSRWRNRVTPPESPRPKGTRMTASETAAPSIAEDLQLMLQRQPGLLEADQVLPGAAALIELTLLGRIRSDPTAGVLNSPADNARVGVVDATPTGSAQLDAALAVLVARGKPTWAEKLLPTVTRAIAPTLQAALVERGIVTPEAPQPGPAPQLQIADESIFQARKAVLNRARTLPATVSDPRLGAVVDVLRSHPTYCGEQGQLAIIAGDWYPADCRDTVASVLRSVQRMFSS